MAAEPTLESSITTSDIRLILLGFRDAGKSSAGNNILGGQQFNRNRIVQCVKGQEYADGRHVTIIEAPGWEKDQLLKDTPKFMKEELTLSVSLCPPGPHSVLLVMSAGMKFTETSRRAAQEHVELLGDDVWTHTIVLFTHGDWLGDSSIEQYIESEGKPLQWLVEKCGNRYHVFSDDKDNKVQVSELFNKVEETVAENSGFHFKIDEKMLEAVEEKRKEEEKNAKEIKNKFLEQSDVLHSTGDNLVRSTQTTKSKTRTNVPRDLTIVLLGHLNAGKCLLGNSLLGRREFQSENTLQSVTKQGEMAGRRITVINTPGWGPEQRLSETPELTRQEIILSVSSCDPGSHVLVLVIRVGDKFTELNRRAVQDHMDLLGPEIWEHTLLVFSCGDRLRNMSMKQYIKREGKPLQWLVHKCGFDGYGILKGTNTSGDVLKFVEWFLAENGSSDYKMDKNLLSEVEDKTKAELERAKQRQQKVEQQWEMTKLERKELCDGLQEIKIKDKPGVETITDPTSVLLHQTLRIILLGQRGAGKTAAGNTILESEAFHTKQSVQSIMKSARVAGRQITVVRASDWPKEQLLMDTPELTKQEIIQSLSMCPPGPHAVLVVINVRLKFNEANRRAVQEHLELLSERIWNHCIVLFTSEEWLGDLTIEQYIESEGKPLQWLIEKCGDRYHVLNYKSRRESSQVIELLQKIEHMVTGYAGSHFEPDKDKLSNLENVRKVEKEQADKRRMTVERHRGELQDKLKTG